MRRRATGLIWVVVVAGFLFPQASSAEPAREVRRVLIINDIGIISSPGFAEIDQAVFTGLQKSPYRIELYEESLDLILFPDRVSQDRFREEIIQKYSARNPDVIIAAGPESLKFIAKLYDKFQGTPIVFCTIWSGIPDQLRRGMPFTGVLAQLRPEGTLSVALHLLPNTKHVVVVGGVGKFDEGWEAIAKQSFHNYESKFEFTYLFDLTMPALLERLKHLPNDTIVFHTSISQDAAGDRFIDSAQSIPMVASAANAPVFVMDDVDLRAGTVGGDLVNWAEDARIAAEIAVRVLNGEKPQDIPVVTSNHAYMFDWRALKRWGLKERDLPPGSIVLNRQPTVWESYKAYIIGGISLILVETLLIVGLVWQRAKRTKAEHQLRESQERLAGIVGSAMDAIIAVDEEQRIVLFNAAAEKMFGCTQDEAVGTVIDRFILERFRSEHGAHMRRFGESGVATRHMGTPTALWAVRTNGQEFPMEASITHLESDGRKLFTVIMRDITERRQAEEAMADLGRRLIEAHEEERTWIARELHDDVNQRIALLAIELDRWNQELSNAPVEVHDHIHHFRKSLDGIANDVQALSHRLHSSKLEYLGIVAAAKSFCKELSEQHKVEIDFSHTAIPQRVPKEISLCLFRVLQETLQNAVKHSGVRHFTVELRGTAGEIQLTVSDLGVGFDPQDAINRRGLGLISMRERLQLVKGQISIESQPGGGTTIYARAPFSSSGASARAG